MALHLFVHAQLIKNVRMKLPEGCVNLAGTKRVTGRYISPLFSPLLLELLSSPFLYCVKGFAISLKLKNITLKFQPFQGDKNG